MGNLGGVVYALVFRFQPVPVGKAFWIAGIIAMVCLTRFVRQHLMLIGALGHQSYDHCHSRAKGLIDKKLVRHHGSCYTLLVVYICIPSCMCACSIVFRSCANL